MWVHFEARLPEIRAVSLRERVKNNHSQGWGRLAWTESFVPVKLYRSDLSDFQVGLLGKKSGMTCWSYGALGDSGKSCQLE